MARNHQAPLIAQKNSIKKFQLKIPLLKQENEDIDSKELTRPQIEAQLMSAQIEVDHESFRKERWEMQKNFRSKYDNEFHQTESILD